MDQYQSVKLFGTRSGPTEPIGPDLGPNCLKGCQQTTEVDSNQVGIFNAFVAVCLVFFFQINFFKKKSIRSAIRVSNGLEPDLDRQNLSVLIWVHTVCKGFQQTTRFDSNLVVIFEAFLSSIDFFKINFLPPPKKKIF